MSHLQVSVAVGKTLRMIETPTPPTTAAASHVRTTCLKFSLVIPLLALTLHTSASSASSRQKTDIVYMRNGDKITCEIQSLEKGQLNVKPDYTSSTVAIDWTKVDRLESSQQFVVTDPHGVLYAGAITRGPQQHTLTIVTSEKTTLPHDSVIEIAELGSTFLKRIRGNIDVGTSFARSNAQKSFTLQSGLTYQSEKDIYSLNSNSQFTTQEKTTNTNETTVKTEFFRQLRKSDWYGGAIANFLSSSEQQIALQSTLGGAFARRIIFTNRTNLTAIGGLGYTIQQDTAGSTSTGRTRSVDSALAVQYSTFRFDSTTFDTTLWLYPSLSSPGRLRMTLNQDIYYKFLGDFYVRVSFYDNYDNQPVVGAPSNNLGASSSIGWSFH
jgi:hypothetical protein